jgi:hypothetical protein
VSKGSNTNASFGYRLHAVAPANFGAGIELTGIPTIPAALEEFWRLHGHDLDPPPHIRDLIRDSIEAARHVIQHRHLAKLDRRKDLRVRYGRRSSSEAATEDEGL